MFVVFASAQGSRRMRVAKRDSRRNGRARTPVEPAEPVPTAQQDQPEQHDPTEARAPATLEDDSPTVTADAGLSTPVSGSTDPSSGDLTAPPASDAAEASLPDAEPDAIDTDTASAEGSSPAERLSVGVAIGLAAFTTFKDGLSELNGQIGGAPLFIVSAACALATTVLVAAQFRRRRIYTAAALIVTLLVGWNLVDRATTDAADDVATAPRARQASTDHSQDDGELDAAHTTTTMASSASTTSPDDTELTPTTPGSVQLDDPLNTTPPARDEDDPVAPTTIPPPPSTAPTSSSHVIAVIGPVAPSPENIEVLGGSIQGPQASPEVGDSITVAVTIRNSGTQAILIDSTFIAGRTPSGQEANSGDDGTDYLLGSGQPLELTSTVQFDQPGVWRFWPCYNLSDSRTCPNNWSPTDVPVS